MAAHPNSREVQIAFQVTIRTEKRISRQGNQEQRLIRLVKQNFQPMGSVTILGESYGLSSKCDPDEVEYTGEYTFSLYYFVHFHMDRETTLDDNTRLQIKEDIERNRCEFLGYNPAFSGGGINYTVEKVEINNISIAYGDDFDLDNFLCNDIDVTYFDESLKQPE